MLHHSDCLPTNLLSTGMVCCALLLWTSCSVDQSRHADGGDKPDHLTSDEVVLMDVGQYVDDNPIEIAEDGPSSIDGDTDVAGDESCDAAGAPIPFQLTGETQRFCAQVQCCREVYIDPAPVYWGPRSAEWTTSATAVLPPCIKPDPDVIIFRASWHDVFADHPLAYGCEEGVCAGTCIPSTGKVYLINTRTDAVRYVGDEDPEAWGPLRNLTPVLGGYEFTVSPEKTYIFTLGRNQYDCPFHPLLWLPCGLEIKSPTPQCYNLPMTAAPGPCPGQFCIGACNTW